MEMLGFWCQVSIKIRILLSIISGQSKSHDLAPIRLPTPTLWRRKLSISIWISMASDDWLPLEIRNGFAFASNCDLPPTWQWCHHHINHTPQLPRSMQLVPSDALDMTDFKVITMLLVFHMGESLSRHLYSWLIPSPIFSATYKFVQLWIFLLLTDLRDSQSCPYSVDLFYWHLFVNFP